MSSRGQTSGHISVLLKQLCDRLSPSHTDAKDSSRLFEYALRLLASNITPSIEKDELQLVETIKRNLRRVGGKTDAEVARFAELHRQLRAQPTIHNTWAAILLLFEVSQDTAVATSSTGTQPFPFDTIVGARGRGLKKEANTNNTRRVLVHGNAASPPVTAEELTGAEHKTSLIEQYKALGVTPAVGGDDNTASEVSEAALLRDVLYVFQGIDGRYISLDPVSDTYRVHREIGVSRATRDLVGKLSELGWLFSQDELLEYFRLISVLEGQLGTDAYDADGVTLRRLVVWTQEPLQRMRMLAIIVDQCKPVMGGAIASTLHRLSRHGDSTIQDLVNRCLSRVNAPIFQMLSRWIYDGELHDAHSEFFVAENPDASVAQQWEQKYAIRKSMLPSFLPRPLADKILLIGKSINYIRHVCLDQDPLTNSVSALKQFDMGQCLPHEAMTSLRASIDSVYTVVSQRLLHILFKKYKLMDHLTAVRRYLLLGQGDFVRHLMGLLEPELCKPAASLYLHNLTSTLETAVRATNAQYDPPDVLARLDVKLFELSPEDTGWDVFTLTYHCDGPIGPVFKKQFIKQYFTVFNFLWRAKRMEHTLAQMWSVQMSFAKELRHVPGMQALAQQCYGVHAAMSHFVNQIQYYFMFEVLECSWDALVKDIGNASDLDQVIQAHETFLNTLIERALLGAQSKKMLSQIRSIFDIIMNFRAAHQKLYDVAAEELVRRQRDVGKAYERTLTGAWGGMSHRDAYHGDTREQQFLLRTLPSMTAKIHVLAKNFKDMVGRLLTMLALHSDPSLRFLSFRIDFNEHYKAIIPEYQDACSPFRPRPGKPPRRAAGHGPSSLGKPQFDPAGLIAGNDGAGSHASGP